MHNASVQANPHVRAPTYPSPHPVTHIQAEERVREEGYGDVTHGLRALRQRLREREGSVRVLHVLDVDALSCSGRGARRGRACYILKMSRKHQPGGREDDHAVTARARGRRCRALESPTALDTVSTEAKRQNKATRTRAEASQRRESTLATQNNRTKACALIRTLHLGSW